ncbi:methyltransferase domain-containing protein [Helicobacter muridarum]|uniref:Methyltransferase domain-containing protein n=1 Tax=Helicobacter muridarum TaxID=216 RepID=A0A377PXY5_9HELI|nr:methyltransferase domain-containing protein [Helicobacter muridarum]TLD98921.1 methyltransferase domain-containing protein [Helicobacter muridarum]STQ87111.1 Uncharacterised protein [Helicobacter muridarum]
MKCKICGEETKIAFRVMILQRYNEHLYKCQNCGFLSVGEAYWLSEAYKNAINISDTGILVRNLKLYTIVVCIAYLFFGFRKQPNQGETEKILLDLGGGNGLLVRLLRDCGIEAFWEDKYCQNFYARGFEWKRLEDSINTKESTQENKYKQNQDNKELTDIKDFIPNNTNQMPAKSPILQPTLSTSFEVFEHLPNPKEEIYQMLSICKNLLFSTEILSSDIPQPAGENAWWYYGFQHGQHISFFTRKSLDFIAKQNNVHFCSYKDLHLFSEYPINHSYFKFAIKLARYIFPFIKKKLGSKTQDDHKKMLEYEIMKYNEIQI